MVELTLCRNAGTWRSSFKKICDTCKDHPPQHTQLVKLWVTQNTMKEWNTGTRCVLISCAKKIRSCFNIDLLYTGTNCQQKNWKFASHTGLITFQLYPCNLSWKTFPRYFKFTECDSSDQIWHRIYPWSFFFISHNGCAWKNFFAPVLLIWSSFFPGGGGWGHCL